MTSNKTIEKTKLIKLLSSFSNLEWKRFGRFVQSPYYNTNQQLVIFYHILKKAFPFNRIKDLELEKIYKKIYGKEVLKLSKFQNLCSDLYSLATDFIVDVHLKQETRKKEKLIIDALSERNYELFKAESYKLIKAIKEQSVYHDTEDFYLLYKLNLDFWQHIETEKFQQSEEKINLAHNYLDKSYHLDKLKYMAAISSRTNFLNTSTVKKIEELKRKIFYQLATKSKNSLLFQEISELHHSPDLTKYHAVKKFILQSFPKLNLPNKRDLIIHLINFVINFRLTSDELHFQEIFNLYQIGVENQLFIVNERMRDIEFVNIGMAGFGVNKIEWTHQFIKNHQAFLSENDREEIVPFVLAYGKLFQKDYEAVIDLLRTVNPKESLKNLFRIKSLLIRAFFECILQGVGNYSQAIQYQLAAFQKQMARDTKNAKTRTQAYLNFILIVKKMLHLLDQNSKIKPSIKSVEILINDTKPLVLAVWLKEKIKEIKGATSEI